MRLEIVKIVIIKKCAWKIYFICHPGRICIRYLCFCEGKFLADFCRKMNRKQHRFLLILRLPNEMKYAWLTVQNITIKMLVHFGTHLKNTNQEAQLCLLVALCYILLPRLFHEPNFLFVSYLYGGAIQIENWKEFSKERKDTSCHIISQKDQKLWRKFTFDISKFKFQNKPQ